jgi:hypothetical protein
LTTLCKVHDGSIDAERHYPMKEQSLLVAIRALHLNGKTGLIEQLRKMGYTVTPHSFTTVSEKDFLTMLKEHQNIIYKLVHLYATSDEDKKDLYQEIVLQAWKAYPQFRGDAKFSTWLLSTLP